MRKYFVYNYKTLHYCNLDYCTNVRFKTQYELALHLYDEHNMSYREVGNSLGTTKSVANAGIRYARKRVTRVETIGDLVRKK